MLTFMSSGPVAAVVIEGVRCIEGFRSLAGTTDPTAATPGSIRGDFGRDWGNGPTENIVHGSDSPQSAVREIGIWFPGCPPAEAGVQGGAGRCGSTRQAARPGHPYP